MSPSEEKQIVEDEARVVDASWRLPGLAVYYRDLRDNGFAVELEPLKREREGFAAHCPDCGNVAHRLYNKRRRWYEFACVERTCGARWAIDKGAEVRL